MIHPVTMAVMKEVEFEAVADYSQRKTYAGLLAELKADPTSDPNRILDYEQRIELIDAKLENPYGQT